MKIQNSKLIFLLVIIKLLIINNVYCDIRELDYQLFSPELSLNDSMIFSFKGFKSLIQDSTKLYNAQIGNISLGFHNSNNRFLYANQEFPVNIFSILYEIFKVVIEFCKIYF